MSSSVVVDPSLAVAWVVQEVHSAAARALLLTWERTRVRRIAPALFASETATALLRCARRGAINAGTASQYLAAVLSAVSLVPDDGALAARALEIAQTLNLGKAYDSLYAALAEREGCDFWTGDERFFNAARPRFPYVQWVGTTPLTSQTMR